MEKQNVDAKAAELREKLKDESLDKCRVAGGHDGYQQDNSDFSSGGGGKGK